MQPIFNQYFLFFIEHFAGVIYSVGETLHGMSISRLELVDNASTLVTLSDDSKHYFYWYQYFLDRKSNLKHCYNHTRHVILVLWLMIIKMLFWIKWSKWWTIYYCWHSRFRNLTTINTNYSCVKLSQPSFNKVKYEQYKILSLPSTQRVEIIF